MTHLQLVYKFTRLKFNLRRSPETRPFMSHSGEKVGGVSGFQFSRNFDMFISHDVLLLLRTAEPVWLAVPLRNRPQKRAPSTSTEESITYGEKNIYFLSEPLTIYRVSARKSEECFLILLSKESIFGANSIGSRTEPCGTP